MKYNSVSLQEVRNRVDIFMNHYNMERIQEKLGYQSPLEFRGMAA
ncbi:IS3 family transposase [Oceanobacillus massiliensis]